MIKFGDEIKVGTLVFRVYNTDGLRFVNAEVLSRAHGDEMEIGNLDCSAEEWVQLCGRCS